MANKKSVRASDAIHSIGYAHSFRLYSVHWPSFDSALMGLTILLFSLNINSSCSLAQLCNRGLNKGFSVNDRTTAHYIIQRLSCQSLRCACSLYEYRHIVHQCHTASAQYLFVSKSTESLNSTIIYLYSVYIQRSWGRDGGATTFRRRRALAATRSANN